MSEWYWSATWDCSDCGHSVPIEPGQNTRPISEAHECDPDELRATKERRAQWWDGYTFALQNLDDEMVQADLAEFGTGWAGITGPLVIDCGDEESG